jgi:hypothetical protein
VVIPRPQQELGECLRHELIAKVDEDSCLLLSHPPFFTE